MRRRVRARIGSRVGACAMLLLLVGACQSGEVRAPAASSPAMVLVGGRVQPTPEAPVIADGVVVIDRGVITASTRASRTRASSRR